MTTRSLSPLASHRGGAQLARFLEPFHCSARSAALLTSHGHSIPFTARLAPRRRSARTATLSSNRLAKRFLFAWRPRRCQWQNGPRANSSAVKKAIMATVLFVVKATIRKDREEAFNRWYNEDHVPQVLQFKGLVSARRYKALEGEDRFQYMAVYELQDEATYRRLLASDHM